MGTILDLLKLTDRYERKARLLPAILSCLSVVPGMAALSASILGWIPSLSVGSGLAVVAAVGLAYVASAAGRKYERVLWPRWPYDAPTNLWLHPEDSSCSREQKLLWYGAVKRLVGLDIAGAAASEDIRNLQLTINDAVRTLRHQFRLTEASGLLDIHNEDYGFARNLAGLRLFWLPTSVIGAIVAWVAYVAIGTDLTWGIFASVALAVCLVLACFLPTYVRQRAERYAESFFGTLVALDKEGSRSMSRSKS